MFVTGQKIHEIFSNLLDKMKLLYEVNEIKCYSFQRTKKQ
jgi:hypothetical protein